ncbi:hypothetical protein Salat_0021100 [Sesamum alatum]|uniref:Uncharacterized protein n=1 Tax=Sesamum alatum TaxID=300844 RepID=A0AAE1YV98_9LAMI|nr:hypothetical protein Salat_0021100 [Sesamum alatum]
MDYSRVCQGIQLTNVGSAGHVQGGQVVQLYGRVATLGTYQIEEVSWKHLATVVAASNRLVDFRVVNNSDQGDETGNIKAKFVKKFRKKEKAKEVVIKTSEPRATERPTSVVFFAGVLNTGCGIA